MTEPVNTPLQALPDGEAEVKLVLRLPWEDVAALGQEAGRLAARLQRPVTLDEAAGQRLRSRPPASHAGPAAHTGSVPPAVSASAAHAGSAAAEGRPAAVGSAPSAPPVSSLPGRSPGEQARQAIEKINGSAVGHETA